MVSRMDGILTPKNRWGEYREYQSGDFVLIADCRTVSKRFHNELGRVLRYHATSGVYAVYVERCDVELVLHKTELRFAHDHSCSN